MAQAFGFETTPKSRPLIIDGLKDVAKYNLENISDFDTLGEMLTFVLNKDWRPEAESGEHDDLVMSLAIAHHIRSQQSMRAETQEQEKTSKWTQDMWDDYNKASPAERELLLQEWGDPE